MNEEEKRVNTILLYENEWGEDMCQWLIDNRIDINNWNVREVMCYFQEWGQDICKKLLMREIELDMKVEMVTAALGKPSFIDNEERTSRTEKYRYVYGVPRYGATYIWFKDGKVTKIKQ